MLISVISLVRKIYFDSNVIKHEKAGILLYLIYHRFSQDAASCTLSGKNIDIMLELVDKVMS